MGDNDFPAMMGNTPIGFVRQFMNKKGMYSQKGDNVPAFTNTMQVSQNQGGPLVAHGSHEPTFIFDEIPRYMTPGSHDPREHKGPVDPSGKEIKELRPKDKDIPLIKAKEMLKGFIT